MRILVVEDDLDLADILQRALREQLHHVEVVHDGESALHTAMTEDFNLVILDVMIPKMDGVSVCGSLRNAGKTTPVIMLTARDKIEDRILGLDAGADDYVVKPFSMGELLARIRAVARRAAQKPTEVLTVGSLSLDPHSSHVQRGKRTIVLTAKEFALLLFFMQHPNQVLTRTEILENVWDANYDGFGNVVEVYVNYLRNKLEEKGEPRVIETIRGRGYLLREDPDGG